MILILRKDLYRSALIGGIAFGLFYFFALKLWVIWFPGTHTWFKFQGMPRWFFWGVPGWEALFEFFFGTYWSMLYSVMFGYEFVPVKKAARLETPNLVCTQHTRSYIYLQINSSGTHF